MALEVKAEGAVLDEVLLPNNVLDDDVVLVEVAALVVISHGQVPPRS